MPPLSSATDAVVIIGGGFAGITTALSLSNCHPRPPIFLIEPRRRFLFLPFLYELLSGELQLWEVAPTYESLLSHKGIVQIFDYVVSIDTSHQKVFTASGLHIDYSQVVLATGSKPDHLNITGMREYALSFHQLHDVFSLRGIIKKLNDGKESTNNLVIVGAGPSGLELACKLSDLVNYKTQIHLIEKGSRVLPRGRSFNQEEAEKALIKKGLFLHLNTRVVSTTDTKVELENCENEQIIKLSLPHNGLIWTAGTTPSLPEFLPNIDLFGGRLSVDQYLQVKDLVNFLAIGDVASNEDISWPFTAQVAIQQGQIAAKNLIALRTDQNLIPFEYHDFGEILSLGIGEGTITGLGLTISGPLAFQIRRLAYLTRVPGSSLGIRSAFAWILESFDRST